MTDKDIEDIVTLRILAGDLPCIRCFAPHIQTSVFCAACHQAWRNYTIHNGKYTSIKKWVWGKSSSIPQWVKRVYPEWHPI